MRHQKLKHVVTLMLSILLFFSCETDAKEDDNVALEPFTSPFQKLYPNGNPIDDGIGVFESYENDQNGNIRLTSSTNSQVGWLEFNGLEINGVGSYDLLHNPSAQARFEAIYSTSVDPIFWINQGGNPNQGGVLNITDYNNGIISGNYNVALWYFSTSLNREVGSGISGNFENIQL